MLEYTWEFSLQDVMAERKYTPVKKMKSNSNILKFKNLKINIIFVHV